MSIKSLRERLKNPETTAKIMNSLSTNKSYEDNRYWKFQVDKNGVGSALIRFLPAIESEELPTVTLYSHSFQDDKTSAWYIENSRTTIGQKDPLSELNRKLWNTGDKSNQDLVRKRKRKTNYISNIYVINDNANPENNGKTFLFKYGPAIHQFIENAMSPKFADEVPFNPFDPWEGADFNLKAFTDSAKGQRSYDKSTFKNTAPLFEDDDDFEKVYNQAYPLQAEVADDKFKSYDELKSRLYQVIGGEDEDDDTESQIDTGLHEIPKTKPKPQTTKSTDDDDDDLGDLADLLNE